MDSLFLIGLAVLIFPFLAIMALVKVVTLTDRVRVLEARLARFEAAARRQSREPPGPARGGRRAAGDRTGHRTARHRTACHRTAGHGT